MNTPETAGPESRREVRFEYSPHFPGILQHCKASLLVSTYQAGKLLVIGCHDGKLVPAFHSFEQAMGIAAGPPGIAVGSRGVVWHMTDSHELAQRIEPAGTHDACWRTRSAHATGNIQIHEMAWSGSELWVVNTLFSALCTLHRDFSFIPRWQPPFVSGLAAEDRCHLNGMALRDGRPAFVTAMSETDTPAGWRPTKATSGVVIDVASGATVARGFAMPHSPRWFGDRLWVLNSGRGDLSTVDPANGRIEPVVSLPGYTRGLALHGQFAFVGLSRIRESAIFGGLPVQTMHDELKCGIAVVDLMSGKNVAAFQFHSGVEEIFDIQVIPGALNPVLSGPDPVKDEARTIWLVPPPGAVPAIDAQGTVPVFGNQMGRADAGPEGFRPAANRKSGGGGPEGLHPAAMSHLLSADPQTLLREAITAHEHGRLDVSVGLYRQALALAPGFADAWNNLGNVYQDLRQPDQALDCYRRAIRLSPESVHAWRNLGYVLKEQGRIEEGMGILEQAQQIESNDVIRYVIATSLPPVYESMDDLRARREKLEGNVARMAADGLKIDIARSPAPTMFYAAYQGLNDRELQRQLASLLAAPQTGIERGARPKGNRIRIGLISRHFRNHTIGRLNIGTVQHLPRDRFEVSVISVGSHDDLFAQRFRAAADHYVALPTNLSAVREQVVAMKLDLLFFADVGMDTLTYSLAMSRLAPVQCCTWGHPVTTGSPEMDAFISSEHLETPAGDGHYTERLVRNPRLAVCYERPAPPKPRPREYFGLDPDRHVYLCFQTLFKFHPEFDAILAGILARDPRGDLILMEGQHPEWTAMLQRRFARTLGEGAKRVRFLPGQSHDDFMSLYGVADVSLDPIHFGGGNTTYEALAIGLPVITWPSEFLRCRLSHAMYRQIGLDDCTASSAEDYIQRAVRIATQPDYRADLSRRIVEQSAVLYDDRATIAELADRLEELVSRR
jgi:protein O-GlcNAc transferase